MASETLERLHWEAHRRPDREAADWYDVMLARWDAYSQYANSIAAKLPFRWHAVACDNPTQNHTGSTNGRSHIVLDEPIDIGRLHRAANYPLCGQNSVNLWGKATDPTCKRCIAVAERIVAQREAQS